MTCRLCGTPFPRDADTRRLYCSGTCRTRAYRARDLAHRQATFDLLRRLTLAVERGDFADLAALQREGALTFC